jgi:hypothetical protein
LGRLAVEATWTVACRQCGVDGRVAPMWTAGGSHMDGAPDREGRRQHVRSGYQACTRVSLSPGPCGTRATCLPVADRAWVPDGRVRRPRRETYCGLPALWNSAKRQSWPVTSRPVSQRRTADSQCFKPKLCPHTRGRMDRAWHHHHARDSSGTGPSLPPPKRRPCRSLPPGTMVIVRGRPHGAPWNRRATACTTRPKARMPRVHPRCPWSDRPASSRYRSIGSRLFLSVPEGRLWPLTRLALPMG